MEMLAPIIVGLLLLAGIGALFAARDVWRPYHITIAVFLILTSTVFVYLAASTLKTHKGYKGNALAHEKAIATEQKNHDTLVYGQPSPDEAALESYGIRRLDTTLQEELAGRGRVWDNGVASGFDAMTGAVLLNFPGGAPRFAENTTVFAFDGRTRAENGQYMGEFLVTGTTADAAQITPVVPLLDWQNARIQEAAGPWVLYEVMPVDRHDIFRNRTEEELRALLPPESVAEYLKDGKPAEPNDPPERVWRELKFTKQHEMKVDDLALTFNEGETAVIDPQTAAELVQAGVAEEVGQIYVRELRDYASMLRDQRRRIQVLMDSNRELTDEVARIVNSIKGVNADIESRKAELAQLEVDKQKFEAERQATEQLAAAINTRLGEVRKELAAIHQNNLALVSEIAVTQRRAVEAVESPAAAPDETAPDETESEESESEDAASADAEPAAAQ